jgi:hypothetical protein
MSASPEERIAESFSLYFSAWGIRVAPEDVVIGSHRIIVDQRSGWRIIYRVDPDEANMRSVEFYATNRFTNDRHVRIGADGHGEHLEAISEIFFVDRDDPDSFAERNASIERKLRDRGLY